MEAGLVGALYCWFEAETRGRDGGVASDGGGAGDRELKVTLSVFTDGCSHLTCVGYRATSCLN
jgi:hypothetical protein